MAAPAFDLILGGVQVFWFQIKNVPSVPSQIWNNRIWHENFKNV
jgi:hypothetical protein